MTEKKPELSLDEVLSSIKKMVVDKDPPVLDLTDMVSEDGTIVKVGEGENENPEGVGAFIKLAKEAENEVAAQAAAISTKEKAEEKEERKRPESPQSCTRAYTATMKQEVVCDIFKDIAEEEIQKWLESNLSKIVTENVDRLVAKWIDENLSRLAGSVVEREIHELLRNRK